MPQKHSVFVTAITCFDKEQRFDPVAQRAHYRRLAAAGIGVYVGGGGTGEAYTLKADELRALLQVAKEELVGKVTTYAMGVEPRTAGEMIDFAKLAEPYGLDGMQLYSLDMGHSGQPNTREKEAYLRTVLETVKRPWVISTHQSVGWYFPIPMLKQLVYDYPHVVGINVTHPDPRFVSELVEAVINKVHVHVGGPMQGLTILAQGGTGFIASEANVAPRTAVCVVTAFEQGDLAKTFGRYGLFDRLRWRMSTIGGSGPGAYAHGNVRGIKATLGVLGLPGGYTRAPKSNATDAERKDIHRWLAELPELFSIEGFKPLS